MANQNNIDDGSYKHCGLVDAAPGVSVATNSDILCRIAKFMPVDTVLSLLIVSGPVAAATVRQSYLLKNDSYLAHTLQKFKAEPSAGIQFDSNFYKHMGGDRMSKEKARFDKYKWDIEAWMAVNTDWRSRHSSQKMRKHILTADEYAEAFFLQERSFSEFMMFGKLPDVNDSDIIWNNPVVAIEIGLTDVVSYLIDVHGFDCKNFPLANGIHIKIPTDFCPDAVADWRSADYTYDTYEGYNYLDLVLYRGDTTMVRKVLFSLKDFKDKYSFVLESVATDYRISTDVLKEVLSFPDVDVNVDVSHRCPTGTILTELVRLIENNTRGIDLKQNDATIAERKLYVEKLGVLLEAGADPFVISKVERSEDNEGEEGMGGASVRYGKSSNELRLCKEIKKSSLEKDLGLAAESSRWRFVRIDKSGGVQRKVGTPQKSIVADTAARVRKD